MHCYTPSKVLVSFIAGTQSFLFSISETSNSKDRSLVLACCDSNISMVMFNIEFNIVGCLNFDNVSNNFRPADESFEEL